MPITVPPDWNTLRNRPSVVNSVNGNTGVVTAAQIIAANAAAAVGDVGTYAFMGSQATSDYTPGLTLAGASLRHAGMFANGWINAGVSTNGIGSNTAAQGTWRCMGRAYGDSAPNFGATVWLRIA